MKTSVLVAVGVLALVVVGFIAAAALAAPRASTIGTQGGYGNGMMGNGMMGNGDSGMRSGYGPVYGGGMGGPGGCSWYAPPGPNDTWSG